MKSILYSLGQGLSSGGFCTTFMNTGGSWLEMAYFTYVDQEARLRGLVPQWSSCKELAIDLEMEANLHHYGLHLAMIQLSDGKDTWLIDPLAIDDLGPIVELFENPAVQKVFHDVSFDFRILEELLACRPKNIFDTKIAALLLGKPSISLGGLLQEYFQVEKQEKFQRIDWLQRPLDQDMLAYAAGDVKYLLQLKHKLEDELKAGGRWPWFAEENGFRTSQSYAVKEKRFRISRVRRVSPIRSVVFSRNSIFCARASQRNWTSQSFSLFLIRCS